MTELLTRRRRSPWSNKYLDTAAPWFPRPSRIHIPTDTASLWTALRGSIALLVILFIRQAVKVPVMSQSGLEVLALPLEARLAEAFVAVLAVGLVTLVYTLLIQRGSLMATTSLYPRRPIEANIGRLLDLAWPASMEDFAASKDPLKGGRCEGDSTMAIKLFYLGKMKDDPRSGFAAKGRHESTAELQGYERRHPVWLASGSPLTKNMVQIMVWEWASLWLLVFLAISTLLFNGFFTDNINFDSYPRLTVILIYVAAFTTHFLYTWIMCLEFFKLVFAGSCWSLLERSKFVVADTHKLQDHPAGSPFTFRSIDKASESYVPITFDATIGNPGPQPQRALSPASSTTLTRGDSDLSSVGTKSMQDDSELRLALGTINNSQRTERETATEASRLALDRVLANTMVMMAVTLSSGFASWTSSQFNDETPNNTTTTQIGSLALLGSLSLGAASMFSSAMHLNIMTSSFRTILSLKETKINGLALDHYRKTRTGAAYASTAANLKPVSFTDRDSVPLANVELADFFAASRSRSWIGFLGMLVFGPGYAMLPRLGDHDRKCAEVEFDFVAPIGGGNVILTTRESDRHAKGQDDRNFDPIITCYVPSKPPTTALGTEPC
ncbi:hypothetical protein S40285_10216 [Stachybotrys chlorohalonatus IBT 40285]|uniref:Uncharacterized protein n=1 Tax=Stachybotrys chlorohalonatus (strain IBT 40285) TaxID=1283841 RepID=A0A084QIP5_STAC4|nr:hypothetical protein S40285_10216 [Stachybotrys chlorohalonata IBT 40285]